MGTSRKPDGLWKMPVLEKEIFKKHGDPRKLFDRMRIDSGFVAAIAECMVSKGRGPMRVFEKTASIRKLMGDGANFFGVEDYENLFGLTFTEEELAAVPDFPWSKKTLTSPCPFNEGLEVRDTHFAFFGLENFNGQCLNMLEWKEIISATRSDIRLNIRPDIERLPVASAASCKFCWYLMTLSAVPTSTNCNRLEQMLDIPEGYTIPRAIEEVTKRILYFKKNGRRFFAPARTEVRCKESIRNGFDVSVSSCEEGTLKIAEASCDLSGPNVGLVLSRKPDNK